MTTAYAYKRVSTKEQGDEGFSLPAQEQSLLDYCRKNNIQLKGMFTDDCTGTNFDRPGFNKLLEANQKSPANLVLFTKWSRFSRDTGKSYQMMDRLKKHGTTVQAIEEKVNLNIPQDQLMLGIQLILPQIDNEIRRDTTMRGTIQARKEGRYTGAAPTGYKNAKDARRKPIIIPDPIKAPFVQKAFRLIAEGKSQNEAREQLRKEGYKVVRSHFFTMLRNDIYIGNVIVPAYKNEPRQVVKGIHEPLIDENLFYTVQDILNGNKRNAPRKQVKLNEYLPLRGFLYCKEHDHKMTGSCSHGHGGKYHYYHCPNELMCQRFQAKEVNESFENLLDNLTLEEGLAEILAAHWEERLRKNPQEIKALNNKIEAQENEINLLVRKWSKDHISYDDYNRVRAICNHELTTLKSELEDINISGNVLTSELDNCFKLLTNLKAFYKNSPPELKPHLIGSILNGKLYFTQKQCRTFSYAPIIDLTSNRDGSFSLPEKQEDKQFSSLVLSRSGGRTLNRTFLPKNAEIIHSIKRLSETFKMLRA